MPRIDFDVVVHSVFRSAANLKLEGDSRLLTLLSSNEADLPQGIRLDTFKGFTFEGWPAGIRGICREGILSFEGFPFVMDLRKAGNAESSLLTFQVDMNNSAVLTAWRSAWRALNDRQISSGSELIAGDLLRPTSNRSSIMVQRMGGALRKILEATRQCGPVDIFSINSLIGLGPGLTPSGDDLLVGYLAGLWCSVNANPERLDFLSALTEAVNMRSDRTNVISRTFLYHACRGHVSGKILDLAAAICTGSNPDRVLDCTGIAMQTGHTSGMDAISGLLIGLMAWTDFIRLETPTEDGLPIN